MINKDLLAGVSQKQQDQLQSILKSPLVWAEVTFPPKIKLVEYVDNNGVKKQFPQVADGWLTRPWQQAVIETPGLKKVLRISRRAGKTATAIVKSLHKSFVEGRGVLVVAPLERQVAEIYNTMHSQFIDTKPEIFGPAIIQDVKSPYTIRFSNGGFINFITAGTKSGGKGDAVRGQGHGVGLIYMDEADYLTDDDIESILAIAAQDPSMEVILTSTPTGKRQKFYHLCTSPPPGWKHFHYSAPQALPNWSEDMELEFRASYSNDAFEREFMAEFGEEATGVFNKDAIEDALRRGQDDFPYPGSSPKYPLYGYAKSLEPNPLVHRIVGVDWDKYGAGTQIVVIEASRAGHDVRDPYAAALDQPFDYIRVIHRREIPKSKFTLANAVRALVNINELFTPQFYYLDAGYGEHQIESLQILGMEQDDPNSPLYGFQHKIVRVNFSHGVEVLDPVSKKIEKRRVKPEMVNRLVNKFDTGEMVMSPFDDELKNQLINYVVTKITASGEPKYGTEDPDGREHAVDALMLAVWGLYSEFGVKLMKSSTKAFIERPIGERYLEMTENVRKKQERSRPDYVALAKRGEIDDDMINDEIKFAKAGMLRRDQITTAAGVPTEPSSRLESNTTFQRGGARGHTGRRGSF